MRDIGWGALVCDTHICKSRRAGPGRDEYGRKCIERYYRSKEEGHPWLVGPTALSAGTLEEGLVLNPDTAS
jgi:hypothetical protein